MGESWMQRREGSVTRLTCAAWRILSPYLIALLLPGSVLLLPIYAWWLDRRRLKRGD